MATKLSKLLDMMDKNDWRSAISLASKFPRLGKYKEDITRAQTAYTYPHFLVEMGIDPDKCKEAGKQALIDAYRQ